MTGKKNSFRSRGRGLQITARTAGAAKNIEVEVDKPLGLTLGQKSGGGVVITAVEAGGNAAKAGLKAGDQVLYTSSFFGDELWPADKLGFTKTAVQAKPDSVYFVVSRGAEVDVKRLPKRPAPPRFGRKLTDAQKVSIFLVTMIFNINAFNFPMVGNKNSRIILPQNTTSVKHFAGQSDSHMPRLWIHIHLAETI
uniref:Electron transporter n=1 Tax=Rhizophora mucronata TaxID=61149 RepID=A0A2P2K550_RHIMU